MDIINGVLNGLKFNSTAFTKGLACILLPFSHGKSALSSLLFP